MKNGEDTIISKQETHCEDLLEKILHTDWEFVGRKDW